MCPCAPRARVRSRCHNGRRAHSRVHSGNRGHFLRCPRHELRDAVVPVRPRRRSNIGVRRDDGLRVIRSSDVRYPGTELPGPVEDVSEFDSWRATGRRLAPVRDTGFAVEGRAARQRRRQTRTRRRGLTVAVLLIAVVSVAAVGWRYSSDLRAAAAPFVTSDTSSSGNGNATGSSAKQSSSKSSGWLFSSENPPQPDPTPIFAEYRSLQLRLPVAIASLDEVGFHQASYTYALHMTTTLPDASLSAAKDKRGTGRVLSKQPTGAGAFLIGKVLRMWRARPGRPDSAADVGAAAGSAVFAPVSGLVIKIKPYKLYGKYDDFEIHIRPDGWNEIDCVMIHVTDLTVAVGARVQGGVTHLASVRMLSDRIHDQLGDYSTGTGDHVHIQLNNTHDPRYKGLQGAIE